MSLFGNDDYVELESDEEKRSKIPIEIEKIKEYADSDRIQRKVREGAIMLVKIKDLKEKDINELKRSVQRIKRTTDAIGGQIVAIGDDWLVVSPGMTKLVR